MKNSSLLFNLIVVFVFLFTSCSKDDSSYCSNEKLGEVRLSDRAENFTPSGAKLVFENTVTRREGDRIEVNKIGGNQGIIGPSECFEYYETYYKLDALVTSDEAYKITIYSFIRSESMNVDSINEIIRFNYSHEDSGNGALGFYDITEEAFSDTAGPHTVKLDSVKLNQETFTDVLKVTNTQYGGTIYFKEGLGVIGFKVGGSTYVLQ